MLSQNYADLETPRFYLPDNITILDDHERQQLKEISLPNLKKLDDVYNRVTASKHHYDLDTLLHTYQTSILQEKRTHWKIIPFCCNYRHCYRCYFRVFGLHPFPKHLLHNSKSRRYYIDFHELRRTQYNTR